LKDGGATDSDRLVHAFRRCLARKPTPEECAPLLALLHHETKRFTNGPANPWDLAVGKPEEAVRLPADATPAQLAGWTVVARVLLNLDETITKE
jgi:hypothetical protein